MRRTDPPELEERRRVSASADSAEEINDTTGVSPWSFIHKIGIVEKEIAETQYWLELFEEVGDGESAARKALLKESGELLAIFIAIGKSTRANKPKPVNPSFDGTPNSDSVRK